jgi:tRNA modification GTPase
MDLSQVEGLADIIDAETEAQRRQAMRQLEGGLGHAVEAWREELLQILASLEASLDFSDEGDVPEGLETTAAQRIEGLANAMAAVLKNRTGERLRDGFVVVLAGAPNAGKSTLLNTLARRDVAIVSPVAGTTRDAIEVRCDLGGLPVTFVDTAGIRDSDDPVEREGVARARAHAAKADLVLWLRAPDGAGETTDESGIARTSPADQPETQVLRVATKADLGADTSADHVISATTGHGIPELLTAIEQAALGGHTTDADVVLTRQRHRNALEHAVTALDRALLQLRNGQDLELVTEEVRLATRAVGRITGRVDVDDVLDRLFASFCIGK